MSEIDLSHGQTAGRRRPRFLRFAILSMMGLCGSMMVAVLLSEYRSAMPAQTLPDGFAEGASALSSQGADAGGDRPAVRVMPADRVPVRRGLTGAD